MPRLRVRPQERPDIDVPRTRFDVGSDVVALVFALLPFAAIPLWGTTEPEANGGTTPHYLLPVIALVSVLTMLVIGRFPRLYNYPWEITEANAARQYRLAMTLVSVLRLCLAMGLGTLSLGLSVFAFPGSAVLAVALTMEAILVIAVVVYIVVARRHR